MIDTFVTSILIDEEYESGSYGDYMKNLRSQNYTDLHIFVHIDARWMNLSKHTGERAPVSLYVRS